MEHIAPEKVDHDLAARMQYTQSFLHFDPSIDGPLINSTKPIIGPMVGNIVDAVYDHLLRYDITAAPFALAQTAEQPSVDVSEIHGDHENIQFRKDFLKIYLVRLTSNTDWTPSSKFWEYLDRVGKAHTGSADSGLRWRSKKASFLVDYREINLLLGWVENAVIDIIMTLDMLELNTKVKLVKTFNKFWWLQNDLFAKHYVKYAA